MWGPGLSDHGPPSYLLPLRHGHCCQIGNRYLVAGDRLDRHCIHARNGPGEGHPPRHRRHHDIADRSAIVDPPVPCVLTHRCIAGDHWPVHGRTQAQGSDGKRGEHLSLSQSTLLGFQIPGVRA